MSRPTPLDDPTTKPAVQPAAVLDRCNGCGNMTLPYFIGPVIDDGFRADYLCGCGWRPWFCSYSADYVDRDVDLEYVFEILQLQYLARVK